MPFTVAQVWEEATTHARGYDRGFTPATKVQAACNYILRRTRRMVRRFSSPLASGTSDYLLPLDCIWNGLRDLRMYDSTTVPIENQEGTEIRIMPDGESVPGTGDITAGAPTRGYLIMGSAPNESRQYVRIVPTPSTVEAGKHLMFRYQARSIRLSSDSDIVPLDDELRPALVYRIAWDLAASVSPRDGMLFRGMFLTELGDELSMQEEDAHPQQYPQMRCRFDTRRRF